MRSYIVKENLIGLGVSKQTDRLLFMKGLAWNAKVILRDLLTIDGFVIQYQKMLRNYNHIPINMLLRNVLKFLFSIFSK